MSGRSGLFILIICLFLTACSGSAQAGTIGNAQRGKALFEQTTIREAPACSTCHSITPGTVIVGPSLAGIGTRAGKRLAGVSAEEYLRQSITNPNETVVDGFSAGIMYPDFKKTLTKDEINDLIAYLLTLQ
jgi:nitric oxide reductase subunit C